MLGEREPAERLANEELELARVFDAFARGGAQRERVRALTNREIAQTLFVTARTVEGHLPSVFRKLQLDSRDGLAALLGTTIKEA
jgi:ATP/maltotriose-dependent transcriptional regulator MalT